MAKKIELQVGNRVVKAKQNGRELTVEKRNVPRKMRDRFLSLCASVVPGIIQAQYLNGRSVRMPATGWPVGDGQVRLKSRQSAMA